MTTPTESAMTLTPDPGHDEGQEARQDVAGHDIRRDNDGSIDFDFTAPGPPRCATRPSGKPSGTYDFQSSGFSA
jgi:hypothetical protein